MGRTKKVGVAGKFGVRYGRVLRERYKKICSYKEYKCPNCLKTGGVKRVSAGIWMCKKCGIKFAGKAYKPY
ncbi:MAG: 50S ribosomal protein L37ae [Candidatus Aenigmatarchaeota archaeon]|nr:MAG: 50S ribosomal protein L37ae [Candidatus Aenigmarchaeota archaeon]